MHEIPRSKCVGFGTFGNLEIQSIDLKYLTIFPSKVNVTLLSNALAKFRTAAWSTEVRFSSSAAHNYVWQDRPLLNSYCLSLWSTSSLLGQTSFLMLWVRKFCMGCWWEILPSLLGRLCGLVIYYQFSVQLVVIPVQGICCKDGGSTVQFGLCQSSVYFFAYPVWARCLAKF